MIADGSTAQQVCWILETHHMLKMEKQLTIKNVSLFNQENNKKEKNIKTKIPMTNKRIKKFWTR